MIVVSTPCCTLNPGMERRWMLHFNWYYFLFFFLPIIFDMLEQFFIGNILIFWPFFFYSLAEHDWRLPEVCHRRIAVVPDEWSQHIRFCWKELPPWLVCQMIVLASICWVFSSIWHVAASCTNSSMSQWTMVWIMCWVMLTWASARQTSPYLFHF